MPRKYSEKHIDKGNIQIIISSKFYDDIIYCCFLEQNYNPTIETDRDEHFIVIRCYVFGINRTFRLIGINCIIIIMYKANEGELNLPSIKSIPKGNKNHDKVSKDFITLVKQRKKEIKERILKTQNNLPDHQEPNHHQNYDTTKKERLITEVPIFRNTYQRKISTPQNIFKRPESGHSQQKRQTNNFHYAQYQFDKSDTGHHKKIKLDPLENEQISEQSKQQNELDDDGSESLQKIDPPSKTMKEDLEILEKIFKKTPLNPKARNQSNIKQIKDYLVEKNMFFGKINPTITLCILKLNRLFIVDRKKYIFKVGQPIDRFFMILQGKIKLYNQESKVKKICRTGETIFEEVLFDKSMKKTALETGKAVSKTFLVELKVENYRKMKEELIRFGYKSSFTEMESMIKRNYILKNWLRNQKLKI